MPVEALFLNGPWDGQVRRYEGFVVAPPMTPVPKEEQPRSPRKRRRKARRSLEDMVLGIDAAAGTAMTTGTIQWWTEDVKPGFYKRERRPVQDTDGVIYARYFWRRPRRIERSLITSSTSTSAANYTWTASTLTASSWPSKLVVISNV